MAEESLDEWTVKANDVFNVTLVTKAEQGPPKTIATFHPTWTYPIFGDEETIYGYKGLKINLRYNASDMRPHLSHTSTKKVPEIVQSTEPAEIDEILEAHLPPVAFGKKADFEAAVQDTPDDWHPPGELIETYEGDSDGQYEVWKGNLADPLVLALVGRIQILVSLFIEGGTPIQTESTEEHEADPLDRWTVFFLYHKRSRSDKPDQHTYVFAGYSTVYRYYIFRPQEARSSTAGELELPTTTMPFSEFPCRSRISQFIILDPFQHKGNGQRLYKPIYKALLNDPNIFEITVEDPNEQFDVLRDMADMAFLQEHQDFNDIAIKMAVQIPNAGTVPKDIVNKEALEALRQKYKIAPRQFSRLVEIHLMSKLPASVRTTMEVEETEGSKGKSTKPTAKPEDEHQYRLWKLITKSRISSQNKEQLSALDPSERIQKLNETLNSVELEYALLISMFEKRKEAKTNDGKKRKLEEDDMENEAPASGKKARTEEKA